LGSMIASHCQVRRTDKGFGYRQRFQDFYTKSSDHTRWKMDDVRGDWRM
jgi:hypothetical protein